MSDIRWMGWVLGGVLPLIGGAALGDDPSDAPARHRAAWMADGSYGIMVHYFPTPVGKNPEELTADFNRQIALFDVDFFLKQFDASKADWLIFTIGQNTGYFNSPNEWLDREAPGFTARRDLMLELAKGVKQRGKRFIVYMSSLAPMNLSPELPPTIADVQKAFAWDEKNLGPFLDRYLEFVKAYSLKFGTLCDGWWYDGCYPSYHKVDGEWPRWIAASRVGNPDAIVAFNDGSFCTGKDTPVSPLQDYHAGEVHLLERGKIRMDYLHGTGVFRNAEGQVVMPNPSGPPKYYMPASQYVDGVQWHALVPVDSTFTPAIPVKYTSYAPDTLTNLVLDCRKVRGAVTYNLPVGLDGHIPETTMQKIEQVGKAVAR